MDKDFEVVLTKIEKRKRCEICKFPLPEEKNSQRFCKPCAHINNHFSRFMKDFDTLNDEGKNYFMFKVTRLWARTFL